MTADDVIERLDLAAHPEGGWFREVHRSADVTHIYFLLEPTRPSHWHRITGTEIWHRYAGGRAELSIASDASVAAHVLGDALADGEVPFAVVPPGTWQSARALDDWVLCGCTVAPAFSFEGFELAPAGFVPPATRPSP